jgi:hypothetical protein
MTKRRMPEDERTAPTADDLDEGEPAWDGDRDLAWWSDESDDDAIGGYVPV